MLQVENFFFFIIGSIDGYIAPYDILKKSCQNIHPLLIYDFSKFYHPKKGQNRKSVMVTTYFVGDQGHVYINWVSLKGLQDGLKSFLKKIKISKILQKNWFFLANFENSWTVFPRIKSYFFFLRDPLWMDLLYAEKKSGYSCICTE